MKSRLWILLAAVLLPFLQACGGDDNNDGNARVRVINATSNFASLDFAVSTTSAAPTTLASSIAAGAASAYVSVTAGTDFFYLYAAGTKNQATATTRSVGGGASYTLVVYTTSGVTTTFLFTDAQAAPGAGNAAFRVFNTSNEAGALDVYLTAPTTDLSTVSPTTVNIAGGGRSNYFETPQGSYRLRVTGAGDKSDIRLDVPTVTLAEKQIATLTLTSTGGGTLVNSIISNENGTTTAFANPAARVRLVANAAASNSVAASVNGVALSSAVSSPSIGNYTLVPAGALSTAVQIGGAAVSVPSFTAVAGSDSTLLVLGTPAAPTVALLADDNSPAPVASDAKVRLVHGLNGLAGAATLTIDFGTPNVATFASASTPARAAGSTGSNDTPRRLDVTAAGVSGSVIPTTNVSLSAGRVYSLFLLGDATAPQGILRRDR